VSEPPVRARPRCSAASELASEPDFPEKRRSSRRLRGVLLLGYLLLDKQEKVARRRAASGALAFNRPRSGHNLSSPFDKLRANGSFRNLDSSFRWNDGTDESPQAIQQSAPADTFHPHPNPPPERGRGTALARAHFVSPSGMTT